MVYGNNDVIKIDTTGRQTTRISVDRSLHKILQLKYMPTVMNPAKIASIGWKS